MAACMKSRARSVAPAFLSRLGIVSAVLVLGLPVASSYCSQPTANSYSRRLGIYFTLERYGSGYGARLTADPVPGSPLRQAQVQLERGDMVTFVDSMPIRGPEDLENHYGQTAVAFVNVRTGAAEARWVYLPALSDPGVPRPTPYVTTGFQAGYSRRLGAYYELVRYGSGYGARLTADPVPGSPLRQAQVQLERGDMVTFVDSMPIRGPEDLENHYGQTAVAFVNVRTGAAEARWVYLPALSDPGLPTPASYADRSLPPITDVPDAPPPIIDIDSIE